MQIVRNGFLIHVSSAERWWTGACRKESGFPMCIGIRSPRTGLGNRIARVLFSLHQERIVALHGFVKKTRKTPDEDFALAHKRKREFEA